MPTNAPAKGYPFSFLVVDDDAFIQNMFVRLLRLWGASRIATASSGVEALACLDAADPKPDALLIDLFMPGMGGVELDAPVGRTRVQGRGHPCERIRP